MYWLQALRHIRQPHQRKDNPDARGHALPSQFMLPGDIVSSGMSGMGLAMAAGTNQYGVSQFTKSSGEGVIDVTYPIDFSQLKRPGAFSSGGLQVNSGVQVVEDYSKLTLVAPSGKVATITVTEPVAVEGDFAAKQDTTKGAGLQKAANIPSGVMGGLGRLGGMKFGNSKTFTSTARPDYQAGATKAATLANARLIDQLTTLRLNEPVSPACAGPTVRSESVALGRCSANRR